MAISTYTCACLRLGRSLSYDDITAISAGQLSLWCQIYLSFYLTNTPPLDVRPGKYLHSCIYLREYAGSLRIHVRPFGRTGPPSMERRDRGSLSLAPTVVPLRFKLSLAWSVLIDSDIVGGGGSTNESAEQWMEIPFVEDVRAHTCTFLLRPLE